MLRVMPAETARTAASGLLTLVREREGERNLSGLMSGHGDTSGRVGSSSNSGASFVPHEVHHDTTVQHVENPSNMGSWGVASITFMLLAFGLACHRAMRIRYDLRDGSAAIIANPPRPPTRWLVLALMIAGQSLTFSTFLSATFFTGEVQRSGVSLSYMGLHTALLPTGGLIASFCTPWLLTVVGAGDLLRMCSPLVALLFVPEGFAAHLHSAAGFICLTAPLELLIGALLSLINTSAISAMFRYAQPSEISLLMGLQTAFAAAAVLVAMPLGATIYTGNGMLAPYTPPRLTQCLHSCTLPTVACALYVS
jgi:hypothetical protein